tara:strand:+ start:131 stop:502 length:372 start_codon:yes stop_codon:yes gene_type:complete
MMMSRFVDEVLAAPMTAEYVLGEVRELLGEMAALNVPGVREEWSDVGMCLQLLVWKHTGGDWKIRWGKRAATKYWCRLRTWRRIFSENGLQFDKKYLVNGGNYGRPHKVKLALELARREQWST